MGAEDFLVRLSTATSLPDATAVLLACPQVKPDPTTPNRAWMNS